MFPEEIISNEHLQVLGSRKLSKDCRLTWTIRNMSENYAITNLEPLLKMGDFVCDSKTGPWHNLGMILLPGESVSLEFDLSGIYKILREKKKLTLEFSLDYSTILYAITEISATWDPPGFIGSTEIS